MRRSNESRAIINFTAQCVTTTTGTGPSITRRNCSKLNTQKSRSSRNPILKIQQTLSTATIRTSAFCALRCVEACQNRQVNEPLSINWKDPHLRVRWDGGSTIGESSCVSCRHCVTVCPCKALIEKSMLGHVGFLAALPKRALDGMLWLALCNS